MAALAISGCGGSVESQRTMDELNYEITDLKGASEKAKLKLAELEDTNKKLEEQNKKLMLLKKKMEINAEYIEELRNSAFEIKPPEDLKIVRLSPGRVAQDDSKARDDRVKKFSSVPKDIKDFTTIKPRATPTAENEEFPNDDIEAGTRPGVVALKGGSGSVKHASRSDLIGSVEELYQRGLDANYAAEYERSREIFAVILEKYPKHNLADNALYWSGETYFSAREYKKAIKKFTEVVKRYPKENKTPDALLKAGFSFIELEKPENAKKILEKVISLYPNSEAAGKAQDRLEEL